MLSSLSIFKHRLLKYLQFPSRTYLSYIGDRTASISHTRLRRNINALKYHLFQKNCRPSPACPLCDAHLEDPKHFLYCPSFAALREKLSASAAHLLGNRWHCASDRKKVDWFLTCISHDDFDTNVTFFQYVQSFISLFNRFC